MLGYKNMKSLVWRGRVESLLRGFFLMEGALRVMKKNLWLVEWDTPPVGKTMKRL